MASDPSRVSEFPAPKIKFVGEQDGASERELKDALAVVLRADLTVRRAYLARVVYDESAPSVILGLLTTGDESVQLAEQIGAVFAAIFNVKAHLDIIFLSDEQDTEIRSVCAAFYEREK